jgi:hypothetical protein
MKDWEEQSGQRQGWGIYLEFWALLTAWFLMAASVIAFYAAPVSAHSGGLAADGCHMDRKAGVRHCHRGPNAGETVQPQRAVGGGPVYFPNCTAARNAGAAPVRRGDPGYGTHLDRDRDGVGCE